MSSFGLWREGKFHRNVRWQRCLVIKPMRRQSKAKTDNVLGIKHHDLVEYTFKNGETHRGYVTALYPELNALNFQSKTKHCKKVNAKKCKLLWKFNKIYWLKYA